MSLAGCVSPVVQDDFYVSGHRSRLLVLLIVLKMTHFTAIERRQTVKLLVRRMVR